MGVDEIEDLRRRCTSRALARLVVVLTAANDELACALEQVNACCVEDHLHTHSP